MIEKTKKAVWAAALALLGSGAAQAGGGAGATPVPCSGLVCKVSVGYALPAAGSNDCSVKVPDAVLVPATAIAVEWSLVPPAAGTAPTHRFAANRIRIDNNVADDAAPARERHFLDDALAASAQTDRKRLVDRSKRRAKKEFPYTVSLQWRDAQGWHDCAPYDPMMVNGE